MIGRDPLRDPEPLIRRVYAFAAYRLGDGPDAEDVTSETFERALRYRDSYDPRKGGAAAWVLGIARRCVEDVLRQRGVDAEVPEQADPRDLEADALERLTLREAIAQLSERDQELLALRYGADLSARQIGALLDLRTNAAEVALHRALARLREALESPGDAAVRKPSQLR